MRKSTDAARGRVPASTPHTLMVKPAEYIWLLVYIYILFACCGRAHTVQLGLHQEYLILPVACNIRTLRAAIDKSINNINLLSVIAFHARNRTPMAAVSNSVAMNDASINRFDVYTPEVRNLDSTRDYFALPRIVAFRGGKRSLVRSRRVRGRGYTTLRKQAWHVFKGQSRKTYRAASSLLESTRRRRT